MSSRAFHRVTVIKGGPSAEREVSLASAAEVSKALRAQGYNVTDVDAGPDLVTELCKSKPDVVYNSLHGRWGEDGCVQGLLEWQQIPYTHSGVFASALAMDKEKSKDVFRAAGLPVMDSRLVPKKDVMAAHPMQPPYVVKPFNEGSSVGVYLVEEASEGTAKLSDDMPDLVMGWCSCETEMDCKRYLQNDVANKTISAGDFTKALLKISTIVRELAGIAEKMNKIECLQKLTQVDSKILKYITTSQSLYI